MREMKMVRKILGPKRNAREIRLRPYPPPKLYQQTEVVFELMKKKWSMQFCGRLLRMDRDRLTKRMFEFLSSSH